MKQESVNGRKNVQIGHPLIDIYRDVGSHYRIRIGIRIFIVHKKASCDLWDESIHLFLICVSFLKRGIHTLKHKVSMSESGIHIQA